MQQRLSHRSQAIQPSATLALSDRARALKAAGHDIIALGVGEPDFDTPQAIKDAAIRAINEGQTRYTAVDGTPELKNAITDKFERDNGLKYTAAQILVSAGGKHSFFNLVLALLNPGDEVIIPAPYWVSYPDMVRVAEAQPKIITTTIEQHFKITAAQLRANLTDKTRLLILNSPSNPTGMAYSADELRELGAVLLEYPNVMVVTDDIYEHIYWGQAPYANIVNACPQLYDRTVVLNGVSKAYAMTGWRIGYVGGPQWLIAAMKKIQSQSTSNPCSIAQAAAAAALAGSLESVHSMVRAFKERHDYVYGRLKDIPGISILPGDGTFYLFPDMKEVIARCGVQDDMALVGELMEAGIALVPGSAFGAPGCVRLSFATSLDLLTQAVDRLQAFVER